MSYAGEHGDLVTIQTDSTDAKIAYKITETDTTTGESTTTAGESLDHLGIVTVQISSATTCTTVVQASCRGGAVPRIGQRHVLSIVWFAKHAHRMRANTIG